MAHLAQTQYCKGVKAGRPEFFQDRLVIDIGSLDINGNNQFLFDRCLYIGVDVAPGRNVDICCKGHELALPDESIDTIISTECFEHDMFYENTIRNIVRMLKPGGLFIFTCATTGRPEHGTRRSEPGNAPLLNNQNGDWADYYKNLEEGDVRACVDVDNIFSEYEFSVAPLSDLYFWGVKKGETHLRGDYSFKIGRD